MSVDKMASVEKRIDDAPKTNMDMHIEIPRGRVVDLTHVLYPGREQYTLEVGRRMDRNGDEGDIMSVVYMWSHVGTHVEAPLHFLAKGEDTSQLKLEQLMGWATVLDFRHKQTKEAISRADMEAAGNIQTGDIVLTLTGRDNLYRTEHSHDRPFIEEDCVRWLIDEKKMRAFGTDSSGFEVRGVSHYPNHRLITRAAIPVLECMTHLQDLKKQRVYLIALPIPVVGLDACPVRAIAIEPDDA